MTREEKIKSFIKLQRYPRWCNGPICACMGCINVSARGHWKQLHPDEPPITKEEFDALKPNP